MILGIMGVFKIKHSQFLHLVTPLPTCITKIKFTSIPPCASPCSDNDLECYFIQNTFSMHVAQVHLVLKSYVPPCSFSSCNVLLILMLSPCHFILVLLLLFNLLIFFVLLQLVIRLIATCFVLFMLMVF